MSFYIAGYGRSMNNASTQFSLPAMSEIFESIFLSEFSPDADPAEISRIVRVSRQQNAAAGLSGLLIFDGTLFCQVLEGPEAAVRRAVIDVEADPRHTQFRHLHRGFIGPKRRFEAWHVGILAPEGASPLRAFESMRGPAAIEHLISLYRDSPKLGMQVL